MGPNCMPKRDGTELTYNSIAAGSLVSAAGGAANYICMANEDDVEYHDEATTANLDRATVRAAEYRMQNEQALDHLLDYLSSVLYVQCPVQ